MPQFDLSQALPQLVWLALVFGVLYLIVQMLYPHLEKVLTDRKERIAGDLRDAEAARDAARLAASGSQDELADARSRALALTTKAADKAAAASREQLAAAAAGLQSRVDTATAALDGQRKAALAELDRLAADAATRIVDHLAGLQVSEQDAMTAIHKVAG